MKSWQRTPLTGEDVPLLCASTCFFFSFCLYIQLPCLFEKEYPFTKEYMVNNTVLIVTSLYSKALWWVQRLTKLVRHIFYCTATWDVLTTVMGNKAPAVHRQRERELSLENTKTWACLLWDLRNLKEFFRLIQKLFQAEGKIPGHVLFEDSLVP